MDNSSHLSGRLIAQITIMFIVIVYISFVNSLSREISQREYSVQSLEINTEQTRPLTSQQKLISTALIQSNVVNLNDTLFSVIARKNNTMTIVPMTDLSYQAFASILIPVVFLLLISIAIPTVSRVQQHRKFQRQLVKLCNESDEIIAFYQDGNPPQKMQSNFDRLSWSLKTLKQLTKDYQIKIEQYIYRDKLTQLTDRHTFLEHLNAQIVSAAGLNEKRGLLFIDLDGFKQVNDSFGHSFGDEILIQVAERLRSVVRSQKLNFNPVDGTVEYNLARLGGDEFTILIQEITSSERTVDIANNILSELERDFVLGNKTIKISASIGIAIYPDSAASPNALLQMADVAMYRAKTDGRGIYRIYSPEMGNKVRRYHYLLDEMRLALISKSFSLSYQPIIQIEDCAIDYFEALVRWYHPVEGNITPGEFIPIAEESNMILELGDWILDEACRQMSAWRNAGMRRVRMSVNVSPIQLKHRHVYPWIKSALDKSGLPASSLMIEITESTFIEATADTISQLEKLRAEGLLIAIDDFGTGFSSLGTLAHLPVDVLKIDRLFITEAQENIKYHKILTSINELAIQLKLKVVAEGVEQAEQLEMLRAMGIEHIQGYFISRPETSITVGSKVLDQGMNHVALTGTALWRPSNYTTKH